MLSYHHQPILKRYADDFPNNNMSAQEAFSELIKYIWLCKKHEEDRGKLQDEALNFTCFIHEEMREIDDMWHTFLLFTQEYHKFCQLYVGYFFHHQPYTGEQEAMSPLQYQRELTSYLTYIYDNLGEATVRKWFKEELS